MFVILGATGNIGSELVARLSHAGHPVLAITHSAEKARTLALPHVEAIALDVNDTEALRAAFRRGSRAFLLNPPADPSGDTNAAELASAGSIAAALDGSGLEKVVAESTYGAQSGDAIGDLSVLFEFERLVAASGIPAAINRGAYYYSNLAMFLEPAGQGVIHVPFPKDFSLPMVAPSDLAEAAADRLLRPTSVTGIRHVEGPRHYSFADVADSFGRALGRPVEVETIPRRQLEQSFRQVGFSPEAARSYARMTEATIDDVYQPQDDPIRGAVALDDYVAGLVADH